MPAADEVFGQGFIELLDNVYKTGEPYIGNELPTRLDHNEDGRLDIVYLNFASFKKPIW